MLHVQDASSKVVPLLPVVARAVKAALMDEACFEVGMEAVRQVAGCVGPAITPHVQDLCSQLAKKALDARAKDAVWRTLQVPWSCCCCWDFLLWAITSCTHHE